MTDPRTAIAQVESLPPVPAIVRKLARLFAKTEIDINQVADAIRVEPGIAAKLLSVVNSAAYPKTREIKTIEDAIVRMGLSELSRLVLSIAIYSQFDTDACPAFRPADYWYDALMVSFCAEKLARHVRTADDAQTVAVAPLCGLFHNIGVLLLAHLFPLPMHHALARIACDERIPLCDAEFETFGFDHHEAGALLLRTWELPMVFSATVEFLGDNDYRGRDWEVAALIRYCSDWSQWDFKSCIINSPLEINTSALAAIGRACRDQSPQVERLAATFQFG